MTSSGLSPGGRVANDRVAVEAQVKAGANLVVVVTEVVSTTLTMTDLPPRLAAAANDDDDNNNGREIILDKVDSMFL
jgi:hypothetical protein